MKQRFLVTSVWLLAASCGVRFAPAPVNEPLPAALKHRAIYPSGVAVYEFQDLVGNILLLEEGREPLRLDVIRPAGWSPEVVVIAEPENYYRSRIQQGAAAQGSYLAIAASLSAEDMAELTLVDAARSAIVFDDLGKWEEIRTKIVDWVKSHPKSNPSQRRVWIKAAVVTRQTYAAFTKIEANASGQIGAVTGVETGVYRRAENEQKSAVIGFEAFDVDRMADSIEREPESATPQQIRDLLFDARYAREVRGEIRKG